MRRILSAVTTAFLVFGLFAAAPSSAVFEEGNLYGNATNQHEGTVKFRFASSVSGAGDLNWVIWTRPVVVYNSHRDRFAIGDDSTTVSPIELRNTRWYGPVGAGPYQNPSTATRHVSGDDALIMSKGTVGGTGNPIKVQVTSPSGTSKTLTVRFPCEKNCSVVVLLAPVFGGEPSDGTWVVSPGPTPKT